MFPLRVFQLRRVYIRSLPLFNFGRLFLHGQLEHIEAVLAQLYQIAPLLSLSLPHLRFFLLEVDHYRPESLLVRLEVLHCGRDLLVYRDPLPRPEAVRVQDLPPRLQLLLLGLLQPGDLLPDHLVEIDGQRLHLVLLRVRVLAQRLVGLLELLQPQLQTSSVTRHANANAAGIVQLSNFQIIN